MDKCRELEHCFLHVESDTIKFFDKGNKAAGLRARKNLLLLKMFAQQLRVLIQETKKGAKKDGADGQQNTQETPDPLEDVLAAEDASLPPWEEEKWMTLWASMGD